MRRMPKFRQDLEESRFPESDGVESVVLKDPVTERYFRLSRYEYNFLTALNGERSVEQAVEFMKGKGVHYSEEDAKLIFTRAAHYGLVLGTPFGTAKRLASLKRQMKNAGKAKFVASSFFYSIPLLNPDAFLGKTVWVFNLIARRRFVLPLFLAALGAIYLVITGWSRVEREYLYFFNARNLFYLTITLTVAKFTHEFSHAYCAKSFGLHVPQMGVSLLMFIPCLFCNTTDAWGLADRRQRMAISAAGILAETIMAVGAAYIWWFTKPGVLNSLAFYLMAVSFVSTIVFNGNPLIKFDGYFVLMDYLRIPNLAQKSMDHVKYLFMNRTLGVGDFRSVAETPRERFIFTLYGFCAILYRVTLYAGLVAGVYYKFDKFIGILLAVPALGIFVIRPLLKGVKTIYDRRSAISLKLRPAAVFVGIAALGLVLLFMPLSLHSTYVCRISSMKSQKITTPIDAGIADVFIHKGGMVAKGDTLFTLDTTFLRHAREQLELDRAIAEKETNLLQLDDSQRAGAQTKVIETLKIDDALARLDAKIELASRGIRAPFSGVVTALDPRVLKGYRPGEGAVIGEIESIDEQQAQALIPEEDLQWVGKDQMVKISLPIGQGVTLSLPVTDLRRFSEQNLTDSPFSSRFGGVVAVESKNNLEDAPLTAFYTCSARIDGEKLPTGMTGKLIVPAPPKSLAARMLNGLQQVFNRESLI